MDVAKSPSPSTPIAPAPSVEPGRDETWQQQTFWGNGFGKLFDAYMKP